MKRPERRTHSWLPGMLALALAVLVSGWGSPLQAQVAVNAPLTGEIELITINDINDHWSGGTMVVGGQVVILPRNLLIDLPANRLTLKQIYDQAPAACLATGETGLAKGDICNVGGAGGFATVTANRTAAGNVIAGDLFVAKGLEAVTGIITYIDYTDGYFRLNGILNNPATGVMVRLNDPDSRHTVQQGLGCDPASAAVNCSPDPRFTLDGDNYTNGFSTGYPLCIPSTVSRPFPGLPAATSAGVPALPAGPTAAAADGTGDLLCPSTNRGTLPVNDSRRFAPILVGDQITAEGNFEIINGVRFLSAHSSSLGNGLTTKPTPDQPDYLFVAEFEVDAAGFQNARARTLMIGFATLAPVDVLIWSLHYDPDTNSPHEFPMASVRGCDIAGGVGTCSIQGLGGGQGNLIWKIRHDIDFLVGAKAKVNPCAHLIADVRFGGGVCTNAAELNIVDQFAIVSPMPHEIQTRTGHSLAYPGLVTLDVNGNEAPNGQYLFPFGVGLGGIAFPEMVEIDLNALAIPFSFTGLPWTLDRRLSPGGCIDTSVPPDGVADCEGTPQPLDPYPFEGAAMNPRFLSTVPQGPYNAPRFTASALTSVSDRILSYVDGTLGNFNGDNTRLAWPPADPAYIAIAPTPIALPSCGGGGVNVPVTAVADAAATVMNVATTIDVLANDIPGTADPASIGIVGLANNGTATANANGTVAFAPTADFIGTASFVYTVNDRLGAASNNATVTVQVTGTPGPGAVPIAAGDIASTLDTTPVLIAVLDNDTDNGQPIALNPLARVDILAQPAPGSGTAVVNPADDNTVIYTPVVGFQGEASFTYSVWNGVTSSNLATVAVTVTRVNTAPLLAAVLNQATVFGVPFTLHVTATDSPGDVLTFSLTSAPAGMTIGAASGLISWTPTAAQIGPNPVTVQVTDQGALIATAGFTVTVGNTAPQLAAIAAQTAGVDALFSLLVNATDTPNDTLGFALDTAPAGMSVDAATGLITWTPAAAQVGAHSVTVRVTDQGGLFATASFTVNVRQDTVSVLQAVFRTRARRWNIQGASTAPGATITIFNSASLTGAPLGTAVVDAFGVWRFRLDRSRLPNAVRRISVRSNAGGTAPNVPVTVLP